jgi:hypothetical protein
MNPLLATYAANQDAIDKIAARRLAASGEYERMCKQLDGAEFTKAWRRREMELVPDQRTAYIITHHMRQAEELLTNRLDQIEAPFEKKAQDEPYPHRDRCRNIRNLPGHLLNRLEPVFSQSALFDPARKFEKQFDTWHKSYVSQLDQAEQNIRKGKGYQTRRCDAYRQIFAREYLVIKAWFDEMATLVGK